MSDIDEIMALEESNRHCAKAIVRLERERDAANAYFQRACERIFGWTIRNTRTIKEIRAEIVAEVDKERERSAGE